MAGAQSEELVVLPGISQQKAVNFIESAKVYVVEQEGIRAEEEKAKEEKAEEEKAKEEKAKEEKAEEEKNREGREAGEG